MKRALILRCGDFGSWDCSCCISCHEDSDQHGYDLFELDGYPGKRNVYGEVCCDLARHLDNEKLEARPLTRKEWADGLRASRAK